MSITIDINNKNNFTTKVFSKTLYKTNFSNKKGNQVLQPLTDTDAPFIGPLPKETTDLLEQVGLDSYEISLPFIQRFTDNITPGQFRLSNTLARISNLQKTIKGSSPTIQDRLNERLETAKDVAEKEFNETIQEDNNKGNNILSKSQKDYLDSDNRRALPGETKSANGKDVDSRRGFVSGRENEGYGFRSTSANYNKATNTFDQRFK